MTPSLPDRQTVVRRVTIGQVLWTIGYTLSSGGFLAYYAAELGAGGLLLALVLTVPDFAAGGSLLARPILKRIGDRRRVYLAGTLIAQGVFLGVPLIGLPVLRESISSPLPILLICLGVSGFIGAVGYVSYLSWIAALVPGENWGYLFARRRIGQLGVLLVLPFLAAWGRRQVSAGDDLDPSLIYSIVFGIGVLLRMASVLPLWSLPEIGPGIASATESNPPTAPKPSPARFARRPWSVSREVLWMWLHNWHLAFANGLTQTVFFLYGMRVLGIDLFRYYALHTLMILLMVPLTEFAGRLADRNREWRGLIVGVPIASCGMLFWLTAVPDQWWWLFGASTCWAVFAVVNLCGRNLVLKLSPEDDNTRELAGFRFVAGVFAGLSGLLGGWLLDGMLGRPGISAGDLDPYLLLMGLSLAGRWTSIVWLIPLRNFRRLIDSDEPPTGR